MKRLQPLTQTLADSIQLEMLKRQIERDMKRMLDNAEKIKAIREKYSEERQHMFI